MQSKKYKIANTVTPSKLYELNFYKIMLLFPQLNYMCEIVNIALISCTDASLQIKIKEQHKYTTEIELHKSLPINKSIKPLIMTLRLYHDARLVEVISFQGSNKLKKYENYPNKDMYLVDEKKQLNFHLQFILNMGLNSKMNKNKKKLSIA